MARHMPSAVKRLSPLEQRALPLSTEEPKVNPDSVQPPTPKKLLPKGRKVRKALRQAGM